MLKKNKIKKNNKKAFFAEVTIDVFAILAIFIIFIIFIVILSFSKNQINVNIKAISSDYDCNIVLMQILNTPIEIDGFKTDFATFIAFSYLDKKHLPKLENNLTNLVTFIADNSNYELLLLTLVNLKDKNQNIGGSSRIDALSYATNPKEDLIIHNNKGSNVNANAILSKVKYNEGCLITIPSFDNNDLIYINAVVLKND
jgi:hypothetical protein